MADLERIYVIPLRGAYEGVRTKRSRKAIKIIRGFIVRHMKAEEENVIISEAVNALIWKRGIQKPPRKIKVKAIKSGDTVNVMLLEEKEVPKEEKGKAEKKALEKPKEEVPKEAEKKEELKPAAKAEEPKATPEQKADVPLQKPETPKEPKTEEKPEPAKEKKEDTAPAAVEKKD